MRIGYSTTDTQQKVYAKKAKENTAFTQAIKNLEI
jgi:hypothetical protein